MLEKTPQTVTVQLDTRAVEIEVSPLNVTSTSFRSKTLTQPSPQLLVIKPSVGDRLFSLVFVFLGTAAVMVGMGLLLGLIQNDHAAAPKMFGLVFLGVGSIFALLGLGMFFWSKTFVFDRKRGTLIANKKTWRFTEILAIQLLFGGSHSSSNEGSSYVTYQLNLIFQDATKTRMNLSNHPDLNWTRSTATKLAAFLKVPLLDQIEPK